MICPNCGTKVDENAVECSFCGYRLSDTPQSNENESEKKLTQKNNHSNLTSTNKKKRAAIIGGICAGCGVTALLIILFTVTGGKKNLTLQEQYESLVAKGETASAKEVPSIEAELESLLEKIEESVSIEESQKYASQKDPEEVATKTESETTTQTVTAPTSFDNSVTLNDAGSVINTQPYQPTSGGGVINADLAELVSRDGTISSIGQTDSYTFTAPRDGRYRAEINGLFGPDSLNIYFFDSSGKLLESRNGCTDGQGVTVKDLVGGETYMVAVEQNSGTGNYYILVGMQKPTIDVSYASQVNDSMDYTDQRNVYEFTAPSDGNFTFEVSGMYDGMSVQMYIFDDPGNKVDYKDNATNGSSLTLKDLKAGDTYEVQVRQKSGFGEYTLFIR